MKDQSIKHFPLLLSLALPSSLLSPHFRPRYAARILTRDKLLVYIVHWLRTLPRQVSDLKGKQVIISAFQGQKRTNHMFSSEGQEQDIPHGRDETPRQGI